MLAAAPHLCCELTYSAININYKYRFTVVFNLLIRRFSFVCLHDN